MGRDIAHAFHDYAEGCSRKSSLSKDEKIKKFWEDLAEDWLALESNQRKIDAHWKVLSEQRKP